MTQQELEEQWIKSGDDCTFEEYVTRGTRFIECKAVNTNGGITITALDIVGEIVSDEDHFKKFMYAAGHISFIFLTAYMLLYFLL